jgi:DNA-binding transcriptional ArsR family regulator
MSSGWKEFCAMAVRGSSTKAMVPKAKAGGSKGLGQGELRVKRAQRTAMLLKHLSDPTRLQIILMLSEGERHVGSLCGELVQSQPAVSHHLALLRHGGVIAPRRDGKNNFYALTDMGVHLTNVVNALM